MVELADRSAAALVADYRASRAGPVEAIRSVLRRMDAWEPEIHALWQRDDDAALAQARAAEARWSAGRPLGALDGVPVTVKENIATAGDPTPLGTAATDVTPATADAPVAARLREAGAIIVGKTTMPDYGMLSSGVSSLHPTTRSPWCRDWNPGGSSAGAAAAAVAGYGPIHIGTDIGGSIRLPAAWCGVVGFKPSFGRVPIDPPYYGRVAGPLTRTVADAAHAMAVISRPDPRDHMSLPPAALTWDAVEAGALGGRRVALCLEAGAGLPVEPETAGAVHAAAIALEAAGAHVEPIGPLIDDDMLNGLDHFWRMRSFLDLEALGPERARRALPYIQAWVAPATGYDARTIFAGLSQMDRMAVAVGAALGDFDLLLSPVAPMATYDADRPSPTADPDRALVHIGFTVPLSMSGHPAVSLPWTTTADGRPLGVQLAGRRFGDVELLAAARACEALRPSQPPWPAAPGT
jgi:aspartyl-tRNA(Asn)/glutamyl-tRNA(Gln) amidotransferase subunit A